MLISFYRSLLAKFLDGKILLLTSIKRNSMLSSFCVSPWKWAFKGGICTSSYKEKSSFITFNWSWLPTLQDDSFHLHIFISNFKEIYLKEQRTVWSISNAPILYYNLKIIEEFKVLKYLLYFWSSVLGAMPWEIWANFNLRDTSERAKDRYKCFKCVNSFF